MSPAHHPSRKMPEGNIPSRSLSASRQRPWSASFSLYTNLLLLNPSRHGFSAVLVNSPQDGKKWRYRICSWFCFFCWRFWWFCSWCWVMLLVFLVGKQHQPRSKCVSGTPPKPQACVLFLTSVLVDGQCFACHDETWLKQGRILRLEVFRFHQGPSKKSIDRDCTKFVLADADPMEGLFTPVLSATCFRSFSLNASALATPPRTTRPSKSLAPGQFTSGNLQICAVLHIALYTLFPETLFFPFSSVTF